MSSSPLRPVASNNPHSAPLEDDGFAIRVSQLSKHYQIYDAPRDRLKQFVVPRLQRLAGRSPRRYFREFRALDAVSFDIAKGETVGIVGRNGSGKSTLLQIVCGTLSPSAGTVETRGRVAALLELGAGFNSEFSGRENVYLNAAVLGLSREETNARYDDIVAFSEIGDFVEQPVKTYSSGMLVRLAFSVAINVDPEILIIDEALAVGDELFQRKCFSRIESIRERGTTILFVSHSGSQIVELCDRAILLDAGERLTQGAPKRIVGLYQKLLYAPAEKRATIRAQIQNGHDEPAPDASQETPDAAAGDLQAVHESFDPELRPSSTIEYESHGASIHNPAVLDPDGRQVNCLVRGRTYRYSYTVRFDRSADNVWFGMMIKTLTGVELGGGVSAPQIKDSLPFVRAGSSVRVQFTFVCALNPGVYFLNAGVAGRIGGYEGYLHRLVDIAMFKVLPDAGACTTGFIDFGCVPAIEECVSP